MIETTAEFRRRRIAELDAAKKEFDEACKRISDPDLRERTQRWGDRIGERNRAISLHTLDYMETLDENHRLKTQFIDNANRQIAIFQNNMKLTQELVDKKSELAAIYKELAEHLAPPRRRH